MSKYSDLLKDPRWQKTRLGILDRDDWKCAYCRATDKTLHVHHHFYTQGSPPWEVPDFALITLCEKCHEEEEMWRSSSDFLHSFFILGMTRLDIMDLADALGYFANDQTNINAVRDKIKAFIQKLKDDNYNNEPGNG